MEELTAGERLGHLLDQLGIGTVHAAMGMASEQLYELMRSRHHAVASLFFVLAPRIMDEELMRPIARSTACLAGEPMTPASRQNKAILERLGSSIIELPGDYAADPWADVANDFGELVTSALLRQAGVAEVAPVYLTPSQGQVEGITYRIDGAGPPLLLLPFGIAASQWEPVLPRLREHFTTIVLGGEHLGFVQLLEERASGGTYIQGVRSLFDLLEIKPGDRVLEIGTGSGALVRDLARRSGGQNEIVAVDINEYLLNEARMLAERAGLSNRIDFRHGSAEALPFPDDSFDAVFAVTVFEECDIEVALAEMRRVLKSGGHAGVVTRSSDLPQFWNLDVPREVLAKINAPMQQTVSPKGSVDARLYTHFARHFEHVKPNPYWTSSAKPLAVTVAQTRALLSPAELEVFDLALADRRNGVSFVATPLHCVTGQKP